MSEPHHSCCSSAHGTSSSTTQSLTEMDFERGLWGAALEEDLARVKHLLDKGTPPSIRDTSGYTPLHYAVRQSSEDLVRALLEKGADPNAQTPSGLSSPLHRAAAKGRSEIVKLLLNHGANPSLQDADGMTALHHSCTTNSSLGPTCAKMLLLKEPSCKKVLNKNGKIAFQLISSVTDDWKGLMKSD